MTWPTVPLDPITRLRAVAAGIPNAAVGEVVLDAPFDDAWAWLMDFERTTSIFDTTVRKVRVRRRTADGLQLWVWAGRFPIPFLFDVTIEDGWCLMRARGRLYVVLMAAVPDPDDPGRTRYAHGEAVPLPGLRRLHGYLAREVASDLRRLVRRVGQ